MDDVFNIAKEIAHVYKRGMVQGESFSLMKLEQIHLLIEEGEYLQAKRELEKEIRRIKGLPF